MEQKEYLWPGGVRLLEAEDVFPPGTDTVLLSDFASLRAGERVCDLGCGGGILLLLLLGRRPDITGDGVELQEQAARLTAENLRYNNMEERGKIYPLDLRALGGTLPAG
jgi:tRNA1(Val) A37 N6-methylase TrmN6